MASYSGRNGRRSRGGPRRRGGDYRPRQQGAAVKTPAKQSLWQKIVGFFGNENPPSAIRTNQAARNGSQREQQQQQPRPSRKPESVEVTSPRLYVGNLSFDATESDLFELFNVVGSVQNAEVVG